MWWWHCTRMAWWPIVQRERTKIEFSLTTLSLGGSKNFASLKTFLLRRTSQGLSTSHCGILLTVLNVVLLSLYNKTVLIISLAVKSLIFQVIYDLVKEIWMKNWWICWRCEGKLILGWSRKCWCFLVH